MKISLLVLLFCIVLIAGLQVLGLLTTSPLFLFMGAFGLAMILIFVGFIMVAKKHKKNQ